MRPGDQGRWIRLRPSVRGTDRSGIQSRDNPQQAPKKDEIFSGAVNAQQFSATFKDHSHAAKVVFGVPSGRKKGV